MGKVNRGGPSKRRGHKLLNSGQGGGARGLNRLSTSGGRGGKC